MKTQTKLVGYVAMLASVAFAPNAMPQSSAESAKPQGLQRPIGGWNYGGLVDKSGENKVSYPYSPINRGAQKNRTAIRGSLRDKNQAAKLIVNGNPMPLYADAEGNFERHYAFGGGANGLEIKQGASTKRVQFYEANPHQQLPKLRIICAWDSPEAEIDLHVLTPDAQHITYSSPVLTTGGGLDVDSVDGPGPENFATSTPVRGAYNIYVNYWGNLGADGYNFDNSQRQKPIVTATITLVFNENTLNEKRETYVVPLRKIGELNFIRRFIY